MSTDPSTPAHRSIDDHLVALAIVTATVVLLYSVLVRRQVLLGVTTLAGLLGIGVFLWLVYRFVIAVETIADSLRRIATSIDEE